MFSSEPLLFGLSVVTLTVEDFVVVGRSKSKPCFDISLCVHLDDDVRCFRRGKCGTLVSADI